MPSSNPATYVDRQQLEQAVSALTQFLALKSQENASSKQKKQKKEPLLGVEFDKERQVLIRNEKVRLMVSFKQTPPNKSTYINLLGPLPHPFHEVADLTVCLIVQDLHPKRPLKDRELDLELTRTHYKEKFLKAGIDQDFINHRLYIMPMRELLTEYRVAELKNKLVKSYDIFLAERSLMNDKNKLLPRFLGSSFLINRKKYPLLVDTKKSGAQLRKAIVKALAKSPFVITGKTPFATALFGYSKQTVEELVDNLSVCLMGIYAKFKKTVQILSLKSETSMPIPFYADISEPRRVLRSMPHAPKGRLAPILGEHPFRERAKILVYPSGKTKLIKNKADLESKRRRVSLNIWLPRRKRQFRKNSFLNLSKSRSRK